MADIREIKSNEEFQEFINTSGSMNCVKISANWCGPCRVLSETIKSLTQEEVDGILLGEVNADDEWFDDLSAELKIRGIPVLLAYRDGELKGRIQGTTPKDKLLEFFNENK